MDFRIEPEDKPGINLWASLSDLFVGLFLITMLGLLVTTNELHKLQKEKEERLRTVPFSDALLKSVAQATKIAQAMQKELQYSLPSQIKSSETEITIPEAALFKSLEYEISSPQQKELLINIRQALKNSLNQVGDQSEFLRVVIEGHTDDLMIPPEKQIPGIETNWELSSRRATGVLRFFQTEGNADEQMVSRKYNVVAVGLADTVPVGDNRTEDGRAKNRRIIIRIEPDIKKIQEKLMH